MKWLEFGEKIQHFFNLEKRRGKVKKISSLSIAGSLVTDETRVSKFVSSFYHNFILLRLTHKFLIAFLRGFRHSHPL